MRKSQRWIQFLLYRKKEENTQWEYLTQAGKECREKEKASYDAEADPVKMEMMMIGSKLNKAWVDWREKQAKRDTEF